MTGNNRLLIVDDDRDTCSNLSDILNEFGYEVDVVYRGWDALDLLKQHTYGMALLDYKLPCMTGVELFMRMRQIRQDLEGFLITGYVSSETTAQAISAGLRQVIHKPVEVPKLMPLVEQVMAGKTAFTPPANSDTHTPNTAPDSKWSAN